MSDAPMYFDPRLCAQAEIVEEEHADGKRCPECTDEGCVRESVWWPVIVYNRSRPEQT